MLGFVSKDGVFYECEYYEHITVAEKLLEIIYGLESNNPVDQLCQLGWIVLQSTFVGFSLKDLKKSPRLTKEQIEFMNDHLEQLNCNQRKS